MYFLLSDLQLSMNNNILILHYQFLFKLHGPGEKSSLFPFLSKILSCTFCWILILNVAFIYIFVIGAFYTHIHAYVKYIQMHREMNFYILIFLKRFLDAHPLLVQPMFPLQIFPNLSMIYGYRYALLIANLIARRKKYSLCVRYS